MSKVDWSKAPGDAEFYAAGWFYKKDGHVYKVAFCSEDGWDDSACQSQAVFMRQKDYEVRPQQWPSEDRIDVIGTNGNEGSHYDQPTTATSKYNREIIGLDGAKTTVDVYRVLDAFKTESAAIDHAVKKLLAAGLRHSKDRKQDLEEAIDSIAAELLLISQR